MLTSTTLVYGPDSSAAAEDADPADAVDDDDGGGGGGGGGVDASDEPSCAVLSAAVCGSVVLATVSFPPLATDCNTRRHAALSSGIQEGMETKHTRTRTHTHTHTHTASTWRVACAASAASEALTCSPNIFFTPLSHPPIALEAVAVDDPSASVPLAVDFSIALRARAASLVSDSVRLLSSFSPSCGAWWCGGCWGEAMST